MAEQRKLSGTWRLFDDPREYQGELIYEEDSKLLAVQLIIPYTEDDPMPRASYKGKIPYVNGRLSNNKKVLLYNCTVHNENIHVYHFTRQLVSAEYCFWGLEATSESDILFTKATFDFGNIIEWSGLCKYEWRLDGDNPIITWVEKQPVEFQLRLGVGVSISPRQGSISIESTNVETTIEQHIEIQLHYDSAVMWDVIMEDAVCVRYLISIGMARMVGIEKTKYQHPQISLEIPSENGIRIVERFSDVWLGTGDKLRTSSSHRYEYHFTLENCLDNSVLDNWAAIYPVLKPVLDLFFAADMHTVNTPEMYCLNLLQALETYHARFVTNKVKEYLRHVDEEVAAFCKGADTVERWKFFLADAQQRKPKCHMVYLKSRLADLIFAEGAFPLIVHKYSFDELIEKLVATRHYYTHYDPAKEGKAFSKEELPWINGRLCGLLSYHILTRLGFDKQKMREKAIERGRISDMNYDVMSKTHRVSR